MDAATIARQFADRINQHDVAGLAALMTEDHRFIDATGALHAGREAMRAGWEHYFAAFPDYRIEIESAIAEGDTVALSGTASGSHLGKGGKAAWRIPAAWRALVRGGKIGEWRVWCDVEPMLQSMGAGRW